MSLADRYRPRGWGDMLGSAVHAEMFRNMAKRRTVPHVLLFSGGRGTGKTSSARLLARSFMCERLNAGDPCGECDPCRQVLGGVHPDVLEVDAASHGGVDDVRALLSGMEFAPVSGKRFLLVDEAQRLSSAASDALLKPLEEPPPHAVFLLCSTEPDRMPATLLSRALRFEFRNLTADELAGRLQRVAEAERIAFDPPALHVLASAAGGSARDALMALELASLAGPVTVRSAEDLLGVVPFEALYVLFDALAGGDGNRAARWMDGMLDRPHAGVALSCLTFLQQLVVMRAGAIRSVRVPEELRSSVMQMATAFELPRLVSMAAAARSALEDVRRRAVPDTSAVLHLMVAQFSVRPDTSAAPSGPRRSLADLVSAAAGTTSAAALSRSTLIRQFFDGDIVRVSEEGAKP